MTEDHRSSDLKATNDHLFSGVLKLNRNMFVPEAIVLFDVCLRLEWVVKQALEMIVSLDWLKTRSADAKAGQARVQTHLTLLGEL